MGSHPDFLDEPLYWFKGIYKQMKAYLTEATLVCPTTGDLLTYRGPNAFGISFEDAQDYCERNGFGYCRVIGQIVSEVPTLPDGITPDWDSEVDFEKSHLN